MSNRHLSNAIKGFRRKGYVPTWEYQKGKNRPMGVLDFLIKEVEARQVKNKERNMKKLVAVLVMMSGVVMADEAITTKAVLELMAPSTEHILYQMEHLPEYREKMVVEESEPMKEDTLVYIDIFVLRIEGSHDVKAGSRLEIVRIPNKEDGRTYTYVQIEEYCGAEIVTVPLVSLNVYKK